MLTISSSDRKVVLTNKKPINHYIEDSEFRLDAKYPREVEGSFSLKWSCASQIQWSEWSKPVLVNTNKTCCLYARKRICEGMDINNIDKCI